MNDVACHFDRNFVYSSFQSNEALNRRIEHLRGARAACPLFADKQTNALFKVNLNCQESRVFASRQTAGRLRLQSCSSLRLVWFSFQFHSIENGYKSLFGN